MRLALDVLEVVGVLVGLALVVYGLALIYPPVAWIAAGGMVVGGVYLVSRSRGEQ